MQTCPHCGELVTPDSGRCTACGASLSQETPGTQPQVVPEIDEQPTEAPFTPVPAAEQSTLTDVEMGDQIGGAADLPTNPSVIAVPPATTGPDPNATVILSPDVTDVPPPSLDPADTLITKPLSPNIPGQTIIPVADTPRQDHSAFAREWSATADDGPTIPIAARLQPDDRLANASFVVRPSTSQSRVFSALGLVVSLALALVLLTLCTFLAPFASHTPQNSLAQAAQPTIGLVRTSAPTLTATPVNQLDFPTEGPDPTPLPYTYATPTMQDYSTATPSPVPSNNPLPTVAPPPPNPGPTAPAQPAILYVFPLSVVARCGKRDVNGILIANLGTSPLNWSAQSTNGGDAQYVLIPQQGVLQANERVTLSIANITHAGTITVQSDGAQNSPQVINVMCNG